MTCVRQLAARAFLLGLALLGFAAMAGPASARFEVCNETSYVTRTALAFEAGDDYSSVGWFTIFPGQCRVLIEKPLTQPAYFIHARSIAGHAGPMRHWAGDDVFCTDGEDFNIKGAAACQKRGYQEAYFEKVDTGGAETWKLTFTEPSGYDLDKAAILGVQRLLVDLDLLARGNQDGYWGRNTIRALEGFRRQYSVQVPSEPTPELFRALVQAVQDKTARLGLELCNRSEVPLWAAVGLPGGRTVQTKGWYEIAAGECAKPVLSALSAGELFVYGETVDAAENKQFWRGDVILCTNDVLFALEGREGECAEDGLQPAPFLRVDTGGQRQFRYEFLAEDARPAGN